MAFKADPTGTVDFSPRVTACDQHRDERRENADARRMESAGINGHRRNGSRIPATQWARPESIFRCSRIPTYWQSGSTSAEPQAPTTAVAAAAAPTPAEAPRAPTHAGLPHLASRGSDSSPSRTRRPSPGPIDHLGTSDWWAQGPGPPGPKGLNRQPVRNRQRQPAPRQHTRRPPNPPSRLLCSRHLPRISPQPEPSKQ